MAGTQSILNIVAVGGVGGGVIILLSVSVLVGWGVRVIWYSLFLNGLWCCGVGIAWIVCSFL